MGISAKELAARLGISAAAVSMALNGKPGVSELTRERVVQAAKEWGYDFNKVRASSSARGKFTFVICKKHGAVVDDTPFFSELTEGVARSCKERGYILDIRYILELSQTSRELKSILDSGADGLLLLGTEMREEDFRAFEDLPIPWVVLDTYFEGLERDCVLINNVQGAYLATNYLISRRKQPPGYLRSSYPIGNFEERADGFYKAVRKNGYSSSGTIVHHLTPSREGAYSDMRELLGRGERTASCYFADNDLIAIGAMRAFKEFGFRIPEDVAIIGFDNTALCELVEPPLTTIHVPKQAMGRQAVERLIDLLSPGAHFPVKVEVLTALVKRVSL